MGSHRVRSLILFLAVAVAFGAGVLWLGPRALQPVTHPDTGAGGASGPSAQEGCASDPAGLPAAPPGPDGRPSNYLHTCGSHLYDSQGREVRIAGLNWNGMETGDYVPGGLGARKWQEILDQIASLGYNTIRLPFSNEALEPNRRVGNVNFTLNPDLQGKNGLEALDLLIAGARERGLKVILDRHVPTPGSQISLWYTRDVPEERWIADWRMLAARYAGNDTVIGFDLSNEVRGETNWGNGDPATDWRLAAERAGNAIHEVNPYLLILVEGIENFYGDHYWWGGDLQGVRTAPVRLRVPNRVVYSPHDYGPSISDQVWFHDPRFPANLPAEWDRRWGYIAREGIAPVVVGEFGGRSFGDDPDGLWQKTLVAYLRARGIGALVWSLNPNWDTGGILTADWHTIDTAKQAEYQQLLAAPLALGAGGVFGRAPARVRVLFRQEKAEVDTRAAFTFAIMNDSPVPLDVGRCELRYWLKAGGGAEPEQVDVELGDQVGMQVLADVVPAGRGGQDGYLRIRFVQSGAPLDRYQASDRIAVRISASGWQNQAATADYSFQAAPPEGDGLREWDRVTLYLDGKLVWGREP